MTAAIVIALLCSTSCAPPARGREVSAQAAPAPGTEAVLEGTLEVLIEDSSQGSRTHYFLVTDSTRVALRFSRSPNLLTGAHIRVRGRWTADGEVEVTSFEVVTAGNGVEPGTFANSSSIRRHFSAAALKQPQLPATESPRETPRNSAPNATKRNAGETYFRSSGTGAGWRSLCTRREQVRGV